MRTWLLILCFFALAGCKKNTDDSTPIPIIDVQGFTTFSKVIVGSPVGSTVVLHNDQTSAVTYVFSGNSDFSFTPVDPVCQGGVAAGATCTYKLTLSAQSKGSKSANLIFLGQLITFSGEAVNPGILVTSPTAIDIGNMVAGDIYRFTLTIKNTGDIRALFPSLSGFSGIGIENQTCGSYVEPGETCTANIVYQNFVKAAALNQTINIVSGNASNTLLVTGRVLAGEISGTIAFATSPASLVADGTTYSFQTTSLKDKYGNEIEDGTEATMTFYNLTDSLGQADPVTLLSSNGRISGQFRSTLQPGPATLSINTFTSSGTLNFEVQGP